MTAADNQTPQDQAMEAITNSFGYHPANQVTGPLHDEVRSMFHNIAQLVNELPGGASRHKSLAITALEQAMHWANAHIAIHHPKSSPVSGSVGAHATGGLGGPSGPPA